MPCGLALRTLCEATLVGSQNALALALTLKARAGPELQALFCFFGTHYRAAANLCGLSAAEVETLLGPFISEQIAQDPHTTKLNLPKSCRSTTCKRTRKVTEAPNGLCLPDLAQQVALEKRNIAEHIITSHIARLEHHAAWHHTNTKTQRSTWTSTQRGSC